MALAALLISRQPVLSSPEVGCFLRPTLLYFPSPLRLARTSQDGHVKHGYEPRHGRHVDGRWRSKPFLSPEDVLGCGWNGRRVRDRRQSLQQDLVQTTVSFRPHRSQLSFVQCLQDVGRQPQRPIACEA